jgi:multiple sugar transport system substrate-binding protein
MQVTRKLFNRMAFGAAMTVLTAVPFGAAQAADPIKLTWLATTRQSPVSTTPEAKAWYQSRLDAWLKAHPGVQIDITTQGVDINAAMTRLQEQVGAGRAPDFASLDSFFLSRFYDKLQPLDAYYPAADVDDFVGFAKAGMRGPDGKLKAVWLNTDVRALFYRTDLVANPPKTWDELLALGETLKAKVATPYVFPGGRGEAAVMEHLPMFWAMGGELVDDKGKPVFGVGKNRDAWIKILGFMKKAVDAGVSTARVANYGSENDMYPELMRGQTAMYLGGSWMPKNMQDLGDKNSWGVAPVPMPGAVGPSTAVGGWTYGVFTADPEKQKLIVDFMNYVVASKEGMAGAVTALSNLPTRKSVAAEASPYLSGDKVKTFSAMLAYGRARPGAAIYPTISTEMQIAISSVITGQKTPEKAVDDAFAKVKQQSGE